MEANKTSPQRVSTNIIWVLVILSMVIILLVAYVLLDRVSCAERIVRYLSYTSTLLSIILSVFAILFSYFSSNQLDKQINDINVAVKEITTTNNQLSQSNQTLVTTLISMHEKLGHIEAIQDYANNNQVPPSSPHGSVFSNKHNESA